MTKKTEKKNERKESLNEAAKEILQASINSSKGEPFGAFFDRSNVKQPAKEGQQELGGPDASKGGWNTHDNGVAQASDAGPKATPPGKTPPIGQMPPKNIQTGDPEHRDRAKINASGVAEETVEEEDDLTEEDKIVEEKDDNDDKSNYISDLKNRVRAKREKEKSKKEAKEKRRDDLDEETIKEDQLDELPLIPMAGSRKQGGCGPSQIMLHGKCVEKKTKEFTPEEWDSLTEEEQDSILEQLTEEEITEMFGEGFETDTTHGHKFLGPSSEGGGTSNEKSPIDKVKPIDSVVKELIKGKEGLDSSEFSKVVNEDLKAMFNGETLSEDFMKKVETIYTNAVLTRATAIAEALEEHYATQLDEMLIQISEDMETKVDDYLNYMVEEWVTKNHIGIQQGLKAELTEDFISGLKELFEQHYIDIPEDKVSIVEEMGEKISELEKSLNEKTEIIINQKKIINEAAKKEIQDIVSEGLLKTQAEKFKKLSENIEYTDQETYGEALMTLRENYFPNGEEVKKIKVSSKKNLTEEKRIVLDEESAEGDNRGVEEIVTSPDMDAYIKAVSKTVKR